MDMTTKLTGVIVSIKGKLRADSDTDKSEAVSVILDIDYSGCTLNDVLQFASADRKIAWVNGTGRKSIGSLTDGQHIKVTAGQPNKVYVDPKVEYKNWFASLSQNEKDAEIAKLMGNN
jgi:hypothetical protein